MVGSSDQGCLVTLSNGENSNQWKLIFGKSFYILLQSWTCIYLQDAAIPPTGLHACSWGLRNMHENVHGNTVDKTKSWKQPKYPLKENCGILTHQNIRWNTCTETHNDISNLRPIMLSKTSKSKKTGCAGMYIYKAQSKAKLSNNVW